MAHNADINVTPMIDVLLVLLVVFMLSVQLRSIFSVNVPPPADQTRATTRLSPQLVLEVREDGSYAINGTPVAVSDVAARLTELRAGGSRKLIFIRGAPKRPYKEVLRAVDLAKGAGWEIVGYMP
jgi:biopolymer transport protein TolR